MYIGSKASCVCETKVVMTRLQTLNLVSEKDSNGENKLDHSVEFINCQLLRIEDGRFLVME
jgi:hypothetical protein